MQGGVACVILTPTTRQHREHGDAAAPVPTLANSGCVVWVVCGLPRLCRQLWRGGCRGSSGRDAFVLLMLQRYCMESMPAIRSLQPSPPHALAHHLTSEYYLVCYSPLTGFCLARHGEPLMRCTCMRLSAVDEVCTHWGRAPWPRPPPRVAASCRIPPARPLAGTWGHAW